MRVRFDRAMDRASVAARFHVQPAVAGSVRWLSSRELAFEHAPLNPSTQYQVVLEGGYSDAQGGANSLRHSWTFRTESPPTLSGSSPGPGDRDVDPASYITLTFSREMDPNTLRSAVSVSPSVPVTIRPDANDARRVILAPESLLEPHSGYSVAVTSDARDVDGNRMAPGSVVSFTTGDVRPLRHWVGFIAQGGTGTAGAGVWIVNENHFPRPLVGTPVSAFTWSSDGSRLLLRSPSGAWSDTALDGSARPLPIHGSWAGYLASGLGYAFLEGGSLQVLRPDGVVVPVASGVTEAAVAPGGSRLAFVARTSAGDERAQEIDGYDVALRSRYRLQAEPGRIDGLAWSPDGQALAYRVDLGDPAHRQIKVRSLRDGNLVKVTTGQVSTPAWQADRQHVFFTAILDTPEGPLTKAFRLPVGDAGSRGPSAAQAMPTGTSVEVSSLSPSADGHQLAFVSDASGRPAVWMMNADGTGLTQLTDADVEQFPYAVQSIAWTPS